MANTIEPGHYLIRSSDLQSGGRNARMLDRNPHLNIIEMWKRADSADFAYFDHVELFTGRFWGYETLFRQWFNTLDASELLEIACGQGRHTALVPEGYNNIFAIDTSVDAIRIATERFKDNPKITLCLSQDGLTIPRPNNSFTGAFSYDAMVHFEPITMASYLKETARVLKPGGRALFHHSAYDRNPIGQFTESPHWRNYMTTDLFAHFASRAGLQILDFRAFPWSDEVVTDALTLLLKPGP